MPDNRYTNAVDLQNTKDYGQAANSEQANKLAQMLQQQSQSRIQQGQFQQQLQQPILNKQAEADIAQQTQDANLAKLKDLMSNRKPGEKTSFSLESNGGVKSSEMQPNPMLLLGNHLGSEGKAISGLASKAYKPIQDQAEAAEATLNSLNQGNSAADKAAIINEANMFLKGGGGRAMGAVMQQLTGESTAEGSMQKAQNWLMNTSNIPTLQPAQRNALREAVHGRIAQLRQQHQQIGSTLPTQAASVAPYTASQGNLQSLVGTYGQGASNSLDRLEKMQQEYNKQKQDANAPVSNPASFNQQPTTFDKLKGFFGMGSSPQTPPPQGGFDPDAYLKGGK